MGNILTGIRKLVTAQQEVTFDRECSKAGGKINTCNETAYTKDSEGNKKACTSTMVCYKHVTAANDVTAAIKKFLSRSRLSEKQLQKYGSCEGDDYLQYGLWLTVNDKGSLSVLGNNGVKGIKYFLFIAINARCEGGFEDFQIGGGPKKVEGNPPFSISYSPESKKAGALGKIINLVKPLLPTNKMARK